MASNRPNCHACQEPVTDTFITKILGEGTTYERSYTICDVCNRLCKLGLIDIDGNPGYLFEE